jgi:hypothetical protein
VYASTQPTPGTVMARRIVQWSAPDGAQLRLEGIDPGGEVIDEGQALPLSYVGPEAEYR